MSGLRCITFNRFYTPNLADISDARTDCYIRFPHTFAANFGLRASFTARYGTKTLHATSGGSLGNSPADMALPADMRPLTLTNMKRRIPDAKGRIMENYFAVFRFYRIAIKIFWGINRFIFMQNM